MDEILEDDFKYKLLIYQILLVYDGGVVEEDFLTNTLEISSFKLSQYIEELVEELKKIPGNNKLERDTHVFQGINFSVRYYQVLRRYYFEQSLEVSVLLQVGVLQNYTLLEFAHLKFISKGTVYSIVKRLNEYLENWYISLKNNRLKGSETAIRFFLFQLFYYFYGSARLPMIKNKKLELGNIITGIQLLYSINFTVNQLAQLETFLTIQFIRIQKNNLIEPNDFFNSEENFFSNLEKWYLAKNKKIFKKDIENESNYLFSFMLLNHFIKNENIEIEFTEVFELFKSISTKKMPELIPLLRGNVEYALKLICFKWKYFSFSFASFVSKDQIAYFQQSFPKIHDVVYTFAESMANSKRKLNDFAMAHLYYDFIFCLLQFEEVLALEKSVHICIDFSGGVTYNNFIKINISSFSYLNLVIDNKITAKTDIYISDFFNSKVTCEQIIWKNPPLDYDWKLFANKVIETKGG